jgi:hypothetical protein
MENEMILKELEKILEKWSIEIKYSKGYFTGGYYRYRDKKALYINKSDKIEDQIRLIISELQKLNLTGINQNPLFKELLAKGETN